MNLTMTMRRDNVTYVAHISEDRSRIQTVEEHCINVSNMCATNCEKFGAYHIGKIAGILHDIGKFCTRFNEYILGNSNARRGEIDHSYAGAKYVMDFTDKYNVKQQYLPMIILLAHVIISHHGIHDWITEDFEDYLQYRISKDDNYGEIAFNTSRMISDDVFLELLSKAYKEYLEIIKNIKLIGNKKSTTISFYLGQLERMIESALIDADRLDTAMFMGNDVSENIDNINDVWNNALVRMNESIESFRNRTDKISKQRMDISDRCANFAKHKVNICKLTVPTGGGKTISSLRFGLEYCNRFKNIEHIIYVAPFMSILEQNSNVISDIIGENYFTEHHSNVIHEDDSDELRAYELHTERWSSPVIATTLVQFLNTLFKSKSSNVRRMHQLSNSIIIIDEVQSIPVNCIHLFNLAMNFISYVCGATVVLCTATQPTIGDVKYSIIEDTDNSMSGDYTVDFEVFKRTDIIPVVSEYGHTYEETVLFCKNRFDENGNLLVILNTKKSARTLFNLMRDVCNNDVTIVHLSTSMCAKHRCEVLDNVRKLLNENKPVICITTQLIEAGVDISFKCVVRSVAGVDNVLQASGRCNRNGECSSIAPVYMIKIKDENLRCLREIQIAQNTTIGMLNSVKDISTTDAITDYFNKLYHNNGTTKLSYPINDNTDTLLNLLSTNTANLSTASSYSKEILNYKYNAQSFKTAGTLFKVIDDNTTGVIIPYDDTAKKLIETIRKTNFNLTNNLKKLQRYTVNVYDNQYQRLIDIGAVETLDNGVLILNGMSYNRDYGIDIENATIDALIF